MAYIRSKKINGNNYLYEQESYRDSSGVVHTRHLRYVGRGNKLGTTSSNHDVKKVLGTTNNKNKEIEIMSKKDIVTKDAKIYKNWEEYVKSYPDRKKDYVILEKKHIKARDIYYYDKEAGVVNATEEGYYGERSFSSKKALTKKGYEQVKTFVILGGVKYYS